MERAIDRWRAYTARFYAWRAGSPALVKFALSMLFAALTGLFAQLRVPLPWTPVPVTGQTFAVMAGGIVIGRWGALAQCFYIIIGAAGVPWFAGGNGGAQTLLGPTAGYLAGFVAASWCAGSYFHRAGSRPSFIRAFIFLAFVETAVILGTGTLFLGAWLAAAGGNSVGLPELLSMGALPFLPGALVKSLAAASLAALAGPSSQAGESITPKRGGNHE